MWLQRAFACVWVRRFPPTHAQGRQEGKKTVETASTCSARDSFSYGYSPEQMIYYTHGHAILGNAVIEQRRVMMPHLSDPEPPHYDASMIKLVSARESVRTRPGMYIREMDPQKMPHQLLW